MADTSTSWRAEGWISDMSEDTGWVNITFNSPYAAYSSYACQVRRIGKTVYARGLINKTDGSWAPATVYNLVANIPAGFRPSGNTLFMPSATNSQGTDVGVLVLETNGNLALRTMNESGSYYSLAGLSWLVD